MEVGLFGKLPSHGDFLRRRASDEFVDAWDAWLQECIAASRNLLGERWLDVYLISPAWRFACEPGVCGQQGYAGIMVPSVDRVGRYFPLTLMWPIPESVAPLAVARRAEHWFDAAERLIVETLAAEQVDFQEFEMRMLGLSQELDRVNFQPAVELDAFHALQLTSVAGAHWQVPLGSPSAWDALTEQLLSASLRRTHRPLALFWTEGSAVVEPSCLVMQGLPLPQQYAALLDGSWREQGWSCVEGRVAPPPAHETTLVVDTTNFQYRSAALSDVGRVRNTNQDAFLERANAGLWVVADGMGGLRDGDVASRMVCDALADLPPRGDLDALVDEVQTRLQAVNTYLQRAANREANPIHSGSTVVVLLAAAHRCVILWAGDSRVYRLRGGRLEQLTRDHSWADEGGGGDDLNAITRAVGGEDYLNLDICYERVQAGDRFLLCSDGLSRELPATRIRELLAQASIHQSVQALVDAALEAGGHDNVTVLAVEANAP